MTCKDLDELQNCLLKAFPSEAALAKMVRVQLGIDLRAEIPGDTRRDLVFELIRWAEARGRVGELVKGAIRSNPFSRCLRNFALAEGYPIESYANLVIDFVIYLTINNTFRSNVIATIMILSMVSAYIIFDTPAPPQELRTNGLTRDEYEVWLSYGKVRQLDEILEDIHQYESKARERNLSDIELQAYLQRQRVLRQRAQDCLDIESSIPINSPAYSRLGMSYVALYRYVLAMSHYFISSVASDINVAPEVELVDVHAEEAIRIYEISLKLRWSGKKNAVNYAKYIESNDLINTMRWYQAASLAHAAMSGEKSALPRALAVIGRVDSRFLGENPLMENPYLDWLSTQMPRHSVQSK